MNFNKYWNVILKKALEEMGEQLDWRHPLRICFILITYALFAFFFSQFLSWTEIFKNIHAYVWYIISLFLTLIPVYILSIICVVPKIILEKDTVINGQKNEIASLEARLASGPFELFPLLLEEWEGLVQKHNSRKRPMSDFINDQKEDEKAMLGHGSGSEEYRLTELTRARIKTYCNDEAELLWRRAEQEPIAGRVERKRNAFRAINTGLKDYLKPEYRIPNSPPSP